jgi:hypothetical protein
MASPPCLFLKIKPTFGQWVNAVGKYPRKVILSFHITAFLKTTKFLLAYVSYTGGFVVTFPYMLTMYLGQLHPVNHSLSSSSPLLKTISTNVIVLLSHKHIKCIDHICPPLSSFLTAFIHWVLRLPLGTNRILAKWMDSLHSSGRWFCADNLSVVFVFWNRVLQCSLGWPQPASASRVLELQVCATWFKHWFEFWVHVIG